MPPPAAAPMPIAPSTIRKSTVQPASQPLARRRSPPTHPLTPYSPPPRPSTAPHHYQDHTYFSNRSASYAGLGDWENAREDGASCIKIKKDFIKGYFRKATAQEALNEL